MKQKNQFGYLCPTKYLLWQGPIDSKGVNMRNTAEIVHPDSDMSVRNDPKVRPNRTTKIHIGESSLSWLYAHGRISLAQLEAGNALRRDFTLDELGCG
jgi:hypothetical protein